MLNNVLQSLSLAGQLAGLSELPVEAVEAALLRLADHWYSSNVHTVRHSGEMLYSALRYPHLEEAARLASVRPGVDYQESVHYFLSSRPAELVLLCLQPDTQQFTARASEEVEHSHI